MSRGTPVTAAAPSPARRRGYLLLGLILSAVFLVLAFRGVDWRALGTALGDARPPYLIATAGLMTASSLVRSLRWRVLLTAHEEVEARLVYWATQVGYLGNNLLPARAGDVIRSAVLSRKLKAGTSFVLATTLTERIVDALTLVVLTVVALLALPSAPDWLMGAARVMAVLGVGGLVAVFAAPRFEWLLARIIRRLPVSEGIRERLAGLLGEFLAGMGTLAHPRRGLSYAGLTGLIWLLDGVTMMTVARGFALHLGLPQALLLIAALGLASAAPSTPGYIGIYQFVAVTVLVPLGFTQSQALADIIGFQGVFYVTVLVWGCLGLWRLGIWPRLPGLRRSLPTE